MASADTKTVQIVVNGKAREVPEGLAVDALLAFLEVDGARVAVERNRAIVRKNDWASVRIEPGDQIEVVWFVGGGVQ